MTMLFDTLADPATTRPPPTAAAPEHESVLMTAEEYPVRDAPVVLPSRLMQAYNLKPTNFLVQDLQRKRMASPTNVSTYDVAQKTAVNVGKQTFYLPADQGHAPAPTHHCLKIIPSQNSPASAWGTGSVNFQIAPGDVELIDRIFLRVDLPAISQTGGSYTRFVNDGHFLLSKIELYSQGADAAVWTMQASGLTQYLASIAHFAYEDKAFLWKATGNAGDSARATAASSAQSIYIPLYIPAITGSKFGFLNAATTGWTIKVYFDSLSNVVQADGTAQTCAPTAANLYIQGRAIDSAAHKQKALSLAATRPMHYKALFPVIQAAQQLASGSSQFTFTLTAFSGMTLSHMWVVVRLSASVNTALANAPDQFVTISTIDLKKSSGEEILANQLPGSYLLGPGAIKPLTGDLSDAHGGSGVVKSAYLISFADSPEDAWRTGSLSGGVAFSGAETMTLTFSSALGALNQADIIGYATGSFVQNNGVVTRSA